MKCLDAWMGGPMTSTQSMTALMYGNIVAYTFGSISNTSGPSTYTLDVRFCKQKRKTELSVQHSSCKTAEVTNIADDILYLNSLQPSTCMLFYVVDLLGFVAQTSRNTTDHGPSPLYDHPSTFYLHVVSHCDLLVLVAQASRNTPQG